MAPLGLLERRRSPNARAPYKPGLPSGVYTYSGLFLARPKRLDNIRPGDDAEALLQAPLQHWRKLAEGVSISEFLLLGGKILTKGDVDPMATLLLPEDESLTMVAPLLRKHPELEELTSA